MTRTKFYRFLFQIRESYNTMKLQVAVACVGLILVMNFCRFCESIRLPLNKLPRDDTKADNANKNSTVDKAPFEFLLTLISPYIAAFSKNNSTNANGNDSIPFYPMNVNFNFNHHETNPKTNATINTEWEFEFELGSYSSGNKGSAGTSGSTEESPISNSSYTRNASSSAKLRNTAEKGKLYQLY